MVTSPPEYLTEAHIGAVTGFGYAAVRRVLHEKVKPCLEIRQARGLTRVYAAARFDEIHQALCTSLAPLPNAPIISRRKN